MKAMNKNVIPDNDKHVSIALEIKGKDGVVRKLYHFMNKHNPGVVQNVYLKESDIKLLQAFDSLCLNVRCTRNKELAEFIKRGVPDIEAFNVALTNKVVQINVNEEKSFMERNRYIEDINDGYYSLKLDEERPVDVLADKWAITKLIELSRECGFKFAEIIYPKDNIYAIGILLGDMGKIAATPRVEYAHEDYYSQYIVIPESDADADADVDVDDESVDDENNGLHLDTANAEANDEKEVYPKNR
jgi:hypothetical protein